MPVLDFELSGRVFSSPSNRFCLTFHCRLICEVFGIRTEGNQTSMPLNEANGEIGGNDVNMTESIPLSPENSLPETTSNLLSLKPTRLASPSSYIVTDDFIFENKQIMDHINEAPTTEVF
ncbi:hypothetical protein CDAR_431561 [Caerostris darwini]|uniref:Uncharacterized protein n=1 Tax=Caerostris darwini TaxID=1538125 RepID=A0AAV4QPB3_9ARAC|nr:hypothetical protein CDAR_431561 [Caerostris darwini]